MKKKVFLQGIVIAFCFLLTGCLALTTETGSTTLDSTTTLIETTTTGTTTASTTALPTTSTPATTTTIATTTANSGFDYLGEIPPTDTALRFDPIGFIATSTWFWHSSPVFSADGTEMYWSKYLVGLDHIQIWYTCKVQGYE
jgi:hypothetical protein